MRAVALALVLLSAPALTGCIDSGDVGRLWNDLDVQPRFRTAELYNHTEAFGLAGILDPANPPGSPGEVGDAFEGSFDVPTGTRTLRILFVVNVTSAPPPPSPLPTPPSGDIRVFARPPGDAAEYNVTMEASGSGGFDVRGPSEGSWAVGFRARGQGSVTFLVDAVVPVGANNGTAGATRVG